MKSKILSVVEIEGNGEHGYQPAIDINALTIRYVMDALERKGLNTMPFTQTPEFTVLSDIMEIFGQTVEKLPDNRLLKNL